MLIRWLACATDETKTLVKSVCETALKSLFWTYTLVYQDLSTRHDWPFKKAIVDLPIRMKGNLKRITDNSFTPLRPRDKDIAAASQTLLTEVKLCLWRRLYGGAIPVSAAFVFAHVHLLGLKGGAMAFVWLPCLLVIQTENWSATSLFLDLLLMLSAIGCWNFLHSHTSIGSEWLCRAEMKESYAEVDSNQSTTGNTPHQLVQCSTVPNNQKTKNM